MTTVESKVVSIKRLDEDVYKVLSNFNNFSPYVDVAKIENWQAGDDWCRFDVQGIKDVGLKIVNKEPYKTIKIAGDGNLPFEFFVWFQLKPVAPYDTRFKITVKANMNFMVKMMIGSKLQQGVDGLADQIALVFNK
jgi:hypothetical protein